MEKKGRSAGYQSTVDGVIAVATKLAAQQLRAAILQLDAMPPIRQGSRMEGRGNRRRRRLLT